MLERIKLSAAWGGRQAGAVVTVDPLRAAQLRSAGLATAADSPDPGRRPARSTHARRRRGRSANRSDDA